MRLTRVLLAACSLSLLGAALSGANACGGSVAGSSDAGSGSQSDAGERVQNPDWTAGSEPSASAIVETDACAALEDCCAAGEAGDLYCTNVTDDCEEAFQYELNYGYCSGYTYTGFTVNTVSGPAGLGSTGFSDGGTGFEDGSSGFGDGGSGFTDASVPPSGAWTPGVEPGADAIVETDACSALSYCCTADDAGDLYCADISLDCDVAFQLELNYGFCSGYTYTGFTVIDVGEPSSPGELPPGSQGDAG